MGLRMAESERLELKLSKPMGLVMEENALKFGGLRVKEVNAGGSAQVNPGELAAAHACRDPMTRWQ